MRVFCRVSMINMVVIYIIAFFSPFSISMGESDLTAAETLIVIWAGLSLILGFIWWACMFYHWGVSQFRSKTTKVTWLPILLIGTALYLIGPVLYYLVVFEKGIGLRKSEELPETVGDRR